MAGRHDPPGAGRARGARRSEGREGAGEGVPVEGDVRRPPRVARRVRLLPVAVRRGGDRHGGRRRRVGHRVARPRPRRRPEAAQGAPLPGFARPALQRVHLLHRLQGELRRVQGDGPRAVRRAALPAAAARPHRPHLRRRVDSHGPVVLQLLPGPHDDRRPLRRGDRRPAARAGVEADAARDGPGAVGPGLHRGGDAEARALRARRNGNEVPDDGRRRRTELRGKRPRCCARGRSRRSGSSRRRATPAVRSAWRSPCGIGISGSRGSRRARRRLGVRTGRGARRTRPAVCRRTATA